MGAAVEAGVDVDFVVAWEAVIELFLGCIVDTRREEGLHRCDDCFKVGCTMNLVQVSGELLHPVQSHRHISNEFLADEDASSSIGVPIATRDKS